MDLGTCKSSTMLKFGFEIDFAVIRKRIMAIFEILFCYFNFSDAQSPKFSQNCKSLNSDLLKDHKKSKFENLRYIFAPPQNLSPNQISA